MPGTLTIIMIILSIISLGYFITAISLFYEYGRLEEVELSKKMLFQIGEILFYILVPLAAVIGTVKRKGWGRIAILLFFGYLIFIQPHAFYGWIITNQFNPGFIIIYILAAAALFIALSRFIIYGQKERVYYLGRAGEEEPEPGKGNLIILTLSLVNLLISIFANTNLLIARDEFGIKTLFTMIFLVLPIYLILLVISFTRLGGGKIGAFLVITVALLFHPYLLEIMIKIDLPQLYYDYFYPLPIIVVLLIANFVLLLKEIYERNNSGG